MRLHEHKACACIWVTGCIEISESSNTVLPAPGDTGREPYMGFSVERGSWAWRGREVSCLPKTMQSPARPRQPSKLGRSCETRSSHDMEGAYTHSCICSATSLCINIFMYMCSDLCLFRHYPLCAQVHMNTQEFLCILVAQHNLTQTSVHSFYRCHPLKGCSPLKATPPPSSPLCLISPLCDTSS